MCLDLDPRLKRDDLLLEDALDANGIVSVTQLLSLRDDARKQLVYEVVQALPVAA